jgi:glycosyltransferase involved in cell wall biosynthesis
MKLSIAMMTKNEQDLLPQCLTSIRDSLGDVEIVIVDTGSTDQTVAIAEAFNAKVYHHPWEDDFSLHRNQSLYYTTGDWILVIDADEKLITTPEFTDKNGLKKWIKEVEQQYTTIALVIKDFQNGSMTMSCNSARLFKKGCIHYQNRVHNAPIFEGAAVLCPQILLEHHGYNLSKEKMKAKFIRTNSLLMQELKDVDKEGNPKNIDTYFYLCQLYGHHGRDKESLKWGYKYLSIRPTVPPDKYNLTIYYTMIKSCQTLGKLDEAYRLITEILKEKPYDPDIAAALADQGAMIENHSMMVEGTKRYIKGYKQMMENPALKAGQFYFSLREDILALNLYRLTIGTLEEGMEAWSFLKPRLEQHASKDILLELETNLTKIGLPYLLKDIDYLYNDIRDMTKRTNKLDVFSIPIG